MADGDDVIKGRARSLTRPTTQFKYDIRVIGDLYSEDDSRATRVSVKIRGNDECEPSTHDGNLTLEGGGRRLIEPPPSSPSLNSDATCSVREPSALTGLARADTPRRSGAPASREAMVSIRPATVATNTNASPTSSRYHRGAVLAATPQRKRLLTYGAASDAPSSAHSSATDDAYSDITHSIDAYDLASSPALSGNDFNTSHKPADAGSEPPATLVGGGRATFGQSNRYSNFGAFPDYHLEQLRAYSAQRCPSRVSSYSTSTQSSSYADKMGCLLSHYFRPNELEEYLRELNQRHRFIGRNSPYAQTSPASKPRPMTSRSPNRPDHWDEAQSHRHNPPSFPSVHAPRTAAAAHSPLLQHEFTKSWASMDEFRPVPPDMDKAFTILSGQPSSRDIATMSDDASIDSPFSSSEASGVKKVDAKGALDAIESNVSGKVKRTEGVFDKIDSDPDDAKSRQSSETHSVKSDLISGRAAPIRHEDIIAAPEAPLRGGGADAYNPRISSDSSASLISLPMSVSSLPSELAAVIRRTGGLTMDKLRASGASPHPQSPSIPSPSPEASTFDGQYTRQAPAPGSPKRSAPDNRGNRFVGSETELDRVLKLTANMSISSISTGSASYASLPDVNRDPPDHRRGEALPAEPKVAQPSRVDDRAPRSRLGGTPRSRLVPPKAPGDLFGGGNNAQRGDAFCGIDALDDSNELDIVFRRTMDYNPSLTSISSTESSSRTPSVANASRASLIRPDYGESEWSRRRRHRSTTTPATAEGRARPTSIINSPFLQSTNKLSSPSVATADGDTFSPRRHALQRDSRRAQRTPYQPQRQKRRHHTQPPNHVTYDAQNQSLPSSSSQRQTSQDPGQERCKEDAAPKMMYQGPPPQSYHQGEEKVEEEAQGSEREPPSPIPKPPTPVFGKFPSPPPYIKSRGKDQSTAPRSNDPPSHAQQQQQQSRHYDRSGEHTGQPRPRRDHDYDVGMPPRNAALLDRLDLDLRSPNPATNPPRSNGGGQVRRENDPYSDSASTLMNPTPEISYANLPKVIEEDDDDEENYLETPVTTTATATATAAIAHKNSNSSSNDSPGMRAPAATPSHRAAQTHRRRSGGFRRVNSDDSLATREIAFTRKSPRRYENAHNAQSRMTIRGGGGGGQGTSPSDECLDDESVIPVSALPTSPLSSIAYDDAGGNDPERCHVCRGELFPVDLLTPHNIPVHKQCLRCERCDRMLTMASYRCADDKFYCENHYRGVMDAKASINEEEGLETLRGGGGGVTTSDTGVQFPMTNLAPIPDFYSFARKAIDTTPLASRFAGRDHVRLMNDAIKASFTSIDDFLRHMRQQQALAAREDSKLSKIVEFNGDYDKKHTLEHQREHLTTPAGTQWMTDRVIDRELKTKVYERKYRIPSMLPPSSSSAAVADQKMGIVEVGVDEQADAATEPEQLRGGGGPRIAGDRSNGRGPVKSKLSQYEGNVGDSRPSTAQSIDRLKNEMKRINGWEHPLCPVCDKVVYIADKVTFECYAYHKTCFRCRKCKRRLMPVSAVRVRGHPYCEVHGAVLLRRRSNILHSAIGRRRQSGGGSSSTYGALGTKLETSAAAAESAGPSESGSSPFKEDHALPDTRQHRRRVSRYRRRSSGRVRTAARHPTRRESAGIDDVKRLANDGERPLQPDSDQRPTYASQALRDFMDATADLIQSEQSTTLGRAAEIENAGSMSGKKSGNGSSQTEGDETRHVVRPASHARSVTLVTSPSKSVFRSTGSGQESVYKPDIVNSLRQEASRMMAEEEERRHSANRSSSQEGYQTPRGSSIAENLTENKATPDQDGLTSISSQFDHFREDPTDKFSPMLARMRPGPFGQAPPGYFAASPFTVLDPKLGGNSQAR